MELAEALQRRIEQYRDNPTMRATYETALQQHYASNPHLRPTAKLEPLATILPRVMDDITATETT